MKHLAFLSALLMCFTLISCGDNDTEEKDPVVAVFRGSFLDTTPSVSVVTEEYSRFSKEQLIEIFNPIITTEKKEETSSWSDETLKADVDLVLRTSTATLNIRGDLITYEKTFEVAYEVMTFTPGEYVYSGIKMKVESDGIYASIGLGTADGTLEDQLLLPLKNFRRETFLSQKETAKTEKKQSIDFHSEVTYTVPVVSLLFSNGTDTYKCTFEDNLKAKLERIEPEYYEFGYLDKQ